MKKYMNLIAMVTIVALLAIGGSAAAAVKDQLNLTVYNSNLALVNMIRQMEIPLGDGEVLFPHIPSSIIANTVTFESLSFPSKVWVREQNYEFDLVSEYKLLLKFVDQKITVVTKASIVYTGYLMSNGNNPVILSQLEGGKGEIYSVQLGDIQSIRYPSLPEGLITRPTLRWLTTNNTLFKNQQVRVSFLTEGLSWSADYVALLSDDDKSMNLTGWVTLTNSSGTTYEDANLKLVAGDVNRVDTRSDYEMMAKVSAMPSPSLAAFEERGMFEYHLYDLLFPTTIKNNQTKQISFMGATSVPVTKYYTYFGKYGSTDVSTIISFKNDLKSGLGIPLPAGVIRVNKLDVDGTQQFVGEDSIEHTPKDEEVTLFLGNAFDIKGSWKQDSFKDISKSQREETYYIEIRNHKDEPVTVRVQEELSYWSQWSIIASSQPFTKLDSTSIQFEPKVPANGTVVITYTVRYSK